MYLTNLHRKHIAIFYFVCFFLYIFHLWQRNLLLSQINPVFFVNNLDFLINVLFLTNLQHQVIQHYWLQLFFDIFNIGLAFTLLISLLKNYKIKTKLAWIFCFFNLIYSILLFTLVTLSIQMYMAWIIFALLFTTKTDHRFYIVLHSLRYYFILIFVSAAIWKIKTGAIFNDEQMGGVLLLQHTAYITANANNWFSEFIYYLIKHKLIAHLLYITATFLEAFFIVGFFTKKIDKLLILFLVLFLSMDFFLLSINYFSWIVFAACFWYSNFKVKNIN